MSPEGATETLFSLAPSGLLPKFNPNPGLASLTRGYHLSPLRGCKKYAASGVPPALPVANEQNMPRQALPALDSNLKSLDGVNIWTMDGKKRADIKPGARVRVVQKQDQSTGRLTEGIVSTILTKSATHPHGIKVRLTSGIVGRVQEILP